MLDKIRASAEHRRIVSRNKGVAMTHILLQDTRSDRVLATAPQAPAGSVLDPRAAQTPSKPRGASSRAWTVHYRWALARKGPYFKMRPAGPFLKNRVRIGL